MNPGGQREEDIFTSAVQLPVERRSAFLDQACANEPELRQRVETLLAALDRASPLLKNPASILPERPSGLPPTEKPGDRIGRYKLLEQIGEGGCGVVYVAEQEEPVRRRVALKIIKLGMDTKQVIARFEAERQALAMMDHPNIAKIFDAGISGVPLTRPSDTLSPTGGEARGEGDAMLSAGRPYFVMELVRGIKITEYCEQNQLAPRERLDLFIQVCRAIQHAHQKGVIHRDIKPSNVLVASDDGVPVPKVIDFGIAKATQGRLTDQTVYTAFEQFIGTPAYMSPEQAALTLQDIDTRSDIYSLGVLLYELLTGTTPFDAKELLAKGLDEMRRTIREVEPVKPSTRLTQERSRTKGEKGEREKGGGEPVPHASSTLNHQLSTDLDWIVMKCLEKERARRYDTASGLAADLQRHLNHEPVAACPPSPAYRFQKLVRRNKWAFTAASVIAACIVLALVTLVFSNVRVSRERNQKSVALDQKAAALDAAQKSEQQARSQLFLALRNQAQERHRRRGMGQRLDSLATVREAANLERDDSLRDIATAALALPDLKLGRSRQALDTNYIAIAFDANYERYAQIDRQATISVRSAGTDGELQRFSSGPAYLPEAGSRGLVFSPDGQFLAKLDISNRWSIWRVKDAQPIVHTPPTEGVTLAFANDSTRIAVPADGSVVIFDLNTRKEQQRWRYQHLPLELEFSPDNRSLAVGAANSPVCIYEVQSGRLQTELPGGPSSDRALKWHPSGEYLAVSSRKQIELWDINPVAKVCAMNGHADVVTVLSFHPSGNWLISDAWDGMPRLWQPSPGREWLCFYSGANHLQFSKDGQYAGMAFGAGGNVQLIEFVPSRVYHTFLSTHGDNTHLLNPGDVSPDGNLLAVGSKAGISIRKLPEGDELAWIPYPGAGFSRFLNARELMISGSQGLAIWPIEPENGSAPKLRVGSPRQVLTPACDDFSGAGDNRTVAIISLFKARVMDLKTGILKKPEFPHPDGCYVAISPDSRWMITSGWQSAETRLWDIQTGENVLTIPSNRARAFFTPDGSEFVVSSSEAYTFYNAQSKKVTRRFEREGNMHFGWIAFSKDAKMMAMETSLGVISLYEVATGRTIARLEDPNGTVGSWMWFTPDGTQLIVVSSSEKAIHRWDLRALRAELKPMGLDWDWPEFVSPP